MRWTILGSGGCSVIPKPLCGCRVCREARLKGLPYSRAGPSAFLHDVNLLIDTPAETAILLNRSRVRRVDYLMFTHLDPDHTEGFRVVEQIALDFRTWTGYPAKRITLLLPEQLLAPLSGISSQYGPVIDFFQASGFLDLHIFREEVQVDDVLISAIPVQRGSRLSFVNVFQKAGKKAVYAPCDIKPFPEVEEVMDADLLIIQPGIFETGLRHRFKYPPGHISRTTLYTFEQTLELARRVRARQVVFVHLEEYWNRGYDDYRRLEAGLPGIRFAHDGMRVKV